MFSSRTEWTQQPNRLALAWTHRKESGLPATDLTESNPTRCGFSYPGEEILRALADPRGLRYEPDPLGLQEARAAVAAHLTRRDHESGAAGLIQGVDPDRICLTASTSEAYAWLFKLLCERGDTVLVPHPSYPLFDYLAELEDVRLRPYPLRYEGTWRIDLDALAAAIDPGTRGIIVVHPNNPTGSLVSEPEAVALGALCGAHDLALISDEVFLDYLFDPATDAGAETRSGRRGPAPARPAGSFGRRTECLTFALDGLSKTAGLPQIKVGWIRAGGPPGVAAAALARLEVIADTYLSVNTPAQRALPELLRLAPGIRAQIAARTVRNLAFLRARARRPGIPWNLLPVDGGWSAVLRLPHIRSEEDWCLRLVETEGVLLHPGYFFDFESEAFVVASLLPEEAAFEDAMGRALDRIEADA